MSRLGLVCLLAAMASLSACSGLFDGIYDDVAPDDTPATHNETQTDSTGTVISGTIYVDASSWADWYYVDLQAMADSAAAGKQPQPVSQPYAVPLELTDDGDGRTGIYTYWFDVWGKGTSVNEFRSLTQTDPQPEPTAWTFAVHRNNVRTNGGAACETTISDIDKLRMDHAQLAGLDYTADTWSETTVWVVQGQMLNSLIGSQGIEVNAVLSSWLEVRIPPMPPAFEHNNHVFVLRTADGKYAALQLENYLSASGTKCCLTINYKYPL